MKRDQLKSLLLGAILLAGITLPAKAQIGEQRHNFAIGINGGANYSTVSFQPTIKQNGLLGITGGVTARYISEKYFAMICGAQLELNFSQRGRMGRKIRSGTGILFRRLLCPYHELS